MFYRDRICRFCGRLAHLLLQLPYWLPYTNTVTFGLQESAVLKFIVFSIGFGKVIWRRTDKLGTEFAISAIPLGGYVKMLDGRNEEVPAELKSQAFESKSVAQRAFVIAAWPSCQFYFCDFGILGNLFCWDSEC